MAAPLIPIIKAVAPYVAQIATVAIPAFTSRNAETGPADPVVAKQIQELQEAATHNAESVQVLADKLQQALDGMEMAARESEARFAKYRLALFASLAVSCAALLVSVFLLLTLS